jgi:hypothetical protein
LDHGCYVPLFIIGKTRVRRSQIRTRLKDFVILNGVASTLLTDKSERDEIVRERKGLVGSG